MFTAIMCIAVAVVLLAAIKGILRGHHRGM